ncbi:MAG TPA: steroid 3-ketoacyl-CoA thiolase [Acidimicrobiales bacterium]|nr:steroid 3-ketoacyl-CoA thiolase [Acidimicrobiales bacterium]
MTEVVIVEAVRTPIGRRNGGLSTMHPADLLAHAQKAVIERAGIDPEIVGQVVTGCVSQVGEQAFNIGRTAWLTAGLPLTVANTTVDAQCGSSQQATNLATALVAGGVTDVAVASGVEVMSRVPIGASGNKALGFGIPIPKSYFPQYEMTSQFEGAERIAEKWGITREDTDRFGLRSQQLAAQAWEEDRFGTQIVPVEAPDVDEEGNPTGTTHTVSRDEGLRETSLEKLAELKPVARPDGVHTAGSSSQISDGAAAVLLMTAERAEQLGLTPKARIVDTCLVGVDPVLMLTGPIDATQHLFERTGLSVDDIDVAEINEAFASVVLAWQKELGFSDEQTNPNGGAIALGHPLGGTGAVLLTKAVHELERTGGRYGLVSMCCGGGLGTGTIIERL